MGGEEEAQQDSAPGSTGPEPSQHGNTLPMGERRHEWRYESPNASAPEMRSLKERIQLLAASIHAAEAELNTLLLQLDDGDGWTGAGIRSMAHWLTLSCGFTGHEAEVRAQLVRRREELPQLFSAFDRGALSVGFMRSAQRVATPDNDAEVTCIATTTTAPQAGRTFGKFRSTSDALDEAAANKSDPETTVAPDTPGADDPDATDPLDPGLWLHTWWDDFERLRIDGRLDTTDGATLMALLEQLRDRPVEHPDESGSFEHEGRTDRAGAGDQTRDRDGGRAKRSTWLSRPEAFSELLRLAGDALTHSGVRNRWVDRFAITVTIDAETLAGRRDGQGTLQDGTTINPVTIRGWLPSASIQGLLTDKRKPLFAGRALRVATSAQRRALLVRDLGCAFPGCCRTDHLDAHHVVEWIDGGKTDIDNMVLLCRRHHRLLHRGEFKIAMIDGLPRIDTGAQTFADRSPPPVPLDALREGSGRDHPRPDATRRSCEPLTNFALDVFLSSLFDAKERAAA